MSLVLLYSSLYDVLMLEIFHIKILPNRTEPLGVEVLKSRGFFTDAYWYWLGVGALSGFITLFNIGFTLALSFLNRLYP